MRWTNKEPLINDKRIKSKFLLFPKTINEETRWLERADWIEKFVAVYVYKTEIEETPNKYFWLPIKWIDNYYD
jgi:hypothetical protein